MSVLGCLFNRGGSMKRAVFRITSPVTAVRHCCSNFMGCLVSERAPCDLPKPTGSFSYDWGIELSAIKCSLRPWANVTIAGRHRSS